MTDELYKFLKGKGLEFCYKEKTPFLVNSWLHYEYCEQFAEHQNKELINKNEELIQARDYFASLCIENGLIQIT